MTIVLTQSEVRALLPMGICIDLVGQALEALSRGAAHNPLRRGMLIEEHDAILGLMPGRLFEPETLGLKVVTVFPENHGTDLDSHQGLVLLLDPKTGVPQAILDGSEITAVRTAAASGLATRLLAREDARTLAILGSGVQARTHLEAMLAVRSIEEVRVFSPDRSNLERFVGQAQGAVPIPVRAVSDAQQAVNGAHVVCTTTSSSVPVLRAAWLSPGVHVNAVGACTPKVRELDTELVLRATVFVDSRESALAEAGDLLIPVTEGAIAAAPIQAEIGEVLAGLVTGRTAPGETTVFKSLGVAVEDLVAARHVYGEALRTGVGTCVALGGARWM